MSRGLIVTAIAVCLSLLACQDDSKLAEGTIAPGLSEEVMEVTVGPELIDCVGPAPMKCLEVDGKLFYTDIDGFEHEEGYTYRLKIERYEAFPGEPPQDASRYGYRLIEVISRTAR